MTIAWLIEDKYTPHVRWWAGYGYSSDANEAIRFARKEDANRVILTVLAHETFTLHAVEHGWHDGDVPE